MSAVFKKLNLKEQSEIVVQAAPASFEPEIASLRSVNVRRALRGDSPVSFALVFVTRQDEVDAAAAAIGKLASGDAIVWFAYPKQSSKNYRSEIDRDTGWRAVGKTGFEPVRMVAIDADWSAVRFRRVEHIKTLTRGAAHAVSAAAKAKIRREAKRGAARPRRTAARR
jgi:hypothetical protein